MTFGLIAPFGIAFWLLRFRRMREGLVHVYGLSYLAATMLFFAASEYRLPILLIVLPCAAAAVLEIWRAFRSGAARLTARMLIFILLFGMMVNFPLPFAASLKSPRMDFFNLGVTLQEAGRHTDAVLMLKRCLSTDPGFAAAHLALGESYLQLGQSEEANEEFRRGGAPLPQHSKKP